MNDGDRTIVLASRSRYRARLLARAGIEVVVDPPDIDERSFDQLFAGSGPEGLALELARQKAMVVASRYADAVVIAADQVGVVGEGPTARMLTKQPDRQGAVAQLMAMSGTEHRLVNGLVVMDSATGRVAEEIDVQLVTMTAFDELTARRYVERFEPFDCSGSYRLEDQARMDRGERLVLDVEGEHDSGVTGLPMPLLGRLMDELGVLITDDR